MAAWGARAETQETDRRAYESGCGQSGGPCPPRGIRAGIAAIGLGLRGGYQPAAGYVDRILKGEKPANLPVQAPTKYELVVNLKTAKEIGIELPTSLLLRADEVIE